MQSLCPPTKNLYTCGMKTCGRCKESKPLDAFPLATTKPGGRGIWCRECHAEAARVARAAKRDGTYVDGRNARKQSEEERRAKRKAWEAANAASMAAYQRQYRQENKEALQAAKRGYYDRVRADGIAAYGGACACCGESVDRFLTLDHIDGRAGEAYRLTGKKAWARLKRLGWPEGYQVLCFNCNCAKGAYGTCPHGIEGQRGSGSNDQQLRQELYRVPNLRPTGNR